MAVYPKTVYPSYGLELTKNYNVLISEFDSGAESRRRLYRFPKRKLHITYNVLSRSDRNTLADHFGNNSGPLTAFNVFDFTSKSWTDEYVVQATGTATGPFDLPGGSISTSSLTVYYNGASTTGYTFYSSFGTDGKACIVFNSAPSSGTLITCDFDGKLAVRARYAKDFAFKESALPRNRYQIIIDLEEVFSTS